MDRESGKKGVARLAVRWMCQQHSPQGGRHGRFIRANRRNPAIGAPSLDPEHPQQLGQAMRSIAPGSSTVRRSPDLIDAHASHNRCADQCAQRGICDGDHHGDFSDFRPTRRPSRSNSRVSRASRAGSSPADGLFNQLRIHTRGFQRSGSIAGLLLWRRPEHVGAQVVAGDTGRSLNGCAPLYRDLSALIPAGDRWRLDTKGLSQRRLATDHLYCSVKGWDAHASILRPDLISCQQGKPNFCAGIV